jgi:hypothetical protein
MTKFFPLLAIIMWSMVAGTSMAQDPVKIKRIQSVISFDGVPDEEAWKTLDNFRLTMHKPDFGADPSEESDVRIGYDNEFLWVGARLSMKDPSKIFAVSMRRDEDLFECDAFGLLMDTYNDNENGLAFFTTPTGLRTDYTISGDAIGGMGPGGPSSMNKSWNTFWDVKTTRDEKGWYVEMRIPFSSLKFKTQNDIATMGVIVTRNISFNNEKDTYPPVDPKYGYMASYKPSLAGTIEIAGARPSRPLYVSPYILGGFSRDWSLDETETAYVMQDDPKLDAGLDIKYNINSNLTLDLTVNTDFAQVEADDQQVNLTRYSLFFPEKRMFFQERSSLFDFSLGGFSDNLFYSRRIGIVRGEPIRILGGARLTGRLGKWDMGFLDMQTAEHEETPGENFGVLRMKRQVINQNSYVGGIFTSRIGMNGDQNFTYGLDGNIRVFGDDYLNVKLAQSYDNKTETGLNSLDPSFILLDWERRSEEGFAYRLNYKYSGLEFNPGIGFVRMGGIQGYGGHMMYGWLPGENSRLFNYSVVVRGERYLRLDDGRLESMTVSPGFEINSKGGIHAEISLNYQQEGVLYDFPLTDSIIIHTGDYSFIGSEITFATSQARRLSLFSEASVGQFYDGRRLGIMAEPTFNVSANINLSLMYEFNAIRFPDRVTNNSANIHSVNAKVLYMLNTKLSASILVQYVNTEKDLIANFRLRYNPREGNDFYLVYNDYRGFMVNNHAPELPGFYNKTVMAKYIHTFVW